MESGHCLEDFPVDIILTEEICYPSTRQMALETREICDIHNISVVYISSDNPPNIQEFESVLGHDVGDVRQMWHVISLNTALPILFYCTSNLFVYT